MAFSARENKIKLLFIIYNIEINQTFKVRHVYCLLPFDAVVVSLQSRVGKVSGTKTETICN